MRVDLALMAELDRAFEKENRQNAQLSELGLSLQSTTQTAEAMQKRLIDQQERSLGTLKASYWLCLTIGTSLEHRAPGSGGNFLKPQNSDYRHGNPALARCQIKLASS
jgi:hypothetical protein